MDKKIAIDAALEELKKIQDFFEVDTLAEEIRQHLLSSIQRGRVILDETAGEVILTLRAPISVENGADITELKFHEILGADIRRISQKNSDDIAKGVHAISLMTGHPIGIVERLSAKDFNVASSIVSLFF